MRGSEAVVERHIQLPHGVSNHPAHCLLPSFETPREARAAPLDEVWFAATPPLHAEERARERLEAWAASDPQY